MAGIAEAENRLSPPELLCWFFAVP